MALMRVANGKLHALTHRMRGALHPRQVDARAAYRVARPTRRSPTPSSMPCTETSVVEEVEKLRSLRVAAKRRAVDLQLNGIERAARDANRVARVVLDLNNTADNRDSSSPPVEVHPALVGYLKPVQAEGIRFLYDATIESVDRIDEPGGGCILAHSMGLGKTLQTIVFLHTVTSHPVLGAKIRRILIVAPKNTLNHWLNEFSKWLAGDGGDALTNSITVFELDTPKTPAARLDTLEKWYNNKIGEGKETRPSAMIIGYELYRGLTDNAEHNPELNGDDEKTSETSDSVSSGKLRAQFSHFLQNPGPDLVICDEAHLLRNDKAKITQCISRIRTLRRICLTGTPMQNHLREYYCMVDFVKPKLLGSKKEFRDRFSTPIEKGRTADASDFDVQLMKHRSFVLYEKLIDVIHRVGADELIKTIPPKQEFVVKVRLQENQRRLSQLFFDAEKADNWMDLAMNARHVLARIWTHPYMLVEKFNSTPEKWAMASVPTVCDDATKEDGDEKRDEKKASKNKRLIAKLKTIDNPGWFWPSGLVGDEDCDKFEQSNKLMVLAGLIKRCEEVGDKILVFTQSIESLLLIKRMLEYYANTNDWFADGHEAIANAGGSDKWGWEEGRDFYLLHGQMTTKQRNNVIKEFNAPENARARVFLISTKAGSLGINLVAASRVVVFDASWNPSHDSQAIFRACRYGQTKPVYGYRLVAQGTMESHIYNREVAKESTAKRVVDQWQIERSFTNRDLHLAHWSYTEEDDDNALETKAPPTDPVLAQVICDNRDRIADFLDHDALLANVEEEQLTPKAIREAWKRYGGPERKNASTFRGETICFNCYEKGHKLADCPRPPRVKRCLNCGVEGHWTGECTRPATREWIDSQRSGIQCHNCGEFGHHSGTCMNAKKDRNELQLVWKCRLCGDVGHFLKNCPKSANRDDDPGKYRSPSLRRNSVQCYKCGEMGHLQVDCMNARKDTKSVEAVWHCGRCGEMGHFFRNCPTQSVSPIETTTRGYSKVGREAGNQSCRDPRVSAHLVDDETKDYAKRRSGRFIERFRRTRERTHDRGG